ncbi:MAG TPA: hypothetical protein VF183_10890 [Acidimicrobiales bacterium]
MSDKPNLFPDLPRREPGFTHALENLVAMLHRLKGRTAKIVEAAQKNELDDNEVNEIHRDALDLHTAFSNALVERIAKIGDPMVREAFGLLMTRSEVANIIAMTAPDEAE